MTGDRSAQHEKRHEDDDGSISLGLRSTCVCPPTIKDTRPKISKTRLQSTLLGTISRLSVPMRTKVLADSDWIGLGGSWRTYWKAVSEKFLSLRECSRSIGMSASFSIALMPMVRCWATCRW